MMTGRALTDGPISSPRGILLNGLVYFYALLFGENGDRVFVRSGSPVLYKHADLLLTDLKLEGFQSAEDPEGFESRLAASDVIDVDYARKSVRRSMNTSDMSAVLDAWNSLSEVMAGLSAPMAFNGKLQNKVYEKLFWGLNLPSVTPPGESYHPTWTRRERRKMFKILDATSRRLASLLRHRGIEGSPRPPLTPRSGQ